jgi:hypothetical protein
MIKRTPDAAAQFQFSPGKVVHNQYHSFQRKQSSFAYNFPKLEDHSHVQFLDEISYLSTIITFQKM